MLGKFCSTNKQHTRFCMRCAVSVLIAMIVFLLSALESKKERY
jgi:hypothetical protein